MDYLCLFVNILVNYEEVAFIKFASKEIFYFTHNSHIFLILQQQLLNIIKADKLIKIFIVKE